MRTLREQESAGNAERLYMQHLHESAQKPTQFVTPDGPKDEAFEKAIAHVRKPGESRAQFISRTGLAPHQAKQLSREQIEQFVKNAAAANEHVVEPKGTAPKFPEKPKHQTFFITE